MRKYVFLFVLFIHTLLLFSQGSMNEKSLFSIHAGPSWYLGKMIGITNHSDTYRSALRDGVAWDVTYNYLGDKYIFHSFKLSPGLIYQGAQYKNTHQDGADKIQMHYIAPQLALFYVKEKYNLSVSTGLGYQFYTDKSIVYDKPRNVSMDKLAYNLSAGGEYRFSRHVGVSAKLNWIVSTSESYSVRYHGQKWQVESPALDGGGGCFSQLSLLVGMNIHF